MAVLRARPCSGEASRALRTGHPAVPPPSGFVEAQSVEPRAQPCSCAGPSFKLDPASRPGTGRGRLCPHTYVHPPRLSEPRLEDGEEEKAGTRKTRKTSSAQIEMLIRDISVRHTPWWARHRHPIAPPIHRVRIGGFYKRCGISAFLSKNHHGAVRCHEQCKPGTTGLGG
jgi:hypothetical protein